jgi:hypothetical protein
MHRAIGAVLSLVVFASAAGAVFGESKPWLELAGGDGPGKGKHVVFLAGDEEYRSEEGLPMLARILSEHHGFKCTVLFPIDPQTGEIDPNNKASAVAG